MIQERLGHATIAETMDTYGHLFPDASEHGRGAIDAALRNAAAEQGRNRTRGERAAAGQGRGEGRAGL